MHIQNNTRVIIHTHLHVSALMTTSSGRTLSYAHLLLHFLLQILSYILHGFRPLFSLKMAQ